MIRLDPSPSKTVVITCDECAFWSAIRFGMEAAHDCACDHERRVHPNRFQARNAAQRWRLRNGVTRR